MIFFIFLCITIHIQIFTSSKPSFFFIFHNNPNLYFGKTPSFLIPSTWQSKSLLHMKPMIFLPFSFVSLYNFKSLLCPNSIFFPFFFITIVGIRFNDWARIFLVSPLPPPFLYFPRYDSSPEGGHFFLPYRILIFCLFAHARSTFWRFWG